MNRSSGQLSCTTATETIGSGHVGDVPFGVPVAGDQLGARAPRYPNRQAGHRADLGSISTLFAQYVAGYADRSVEHRGKDGEAGAVWSMAELQALLDEWIVAVWQNAKGPDRIPTHPTTPDLAPWLPERAGPSAGNACPGERPSQFTRRHGQPNQRAHGEIPQFHWQTGARNRTRPCHSS